MTDSDTCKATIRMFLELKLVSQFHIPYPVRRKCCCWKSNFSDFYELAESCSRTICFLQFQVLCRWVLSVKKNYRPVKYHNWRHAFNVVRLSSVFILFGCFMGIFRHAMRPSYNNSSRFYLVQRTKKCIHCVNKLTCLDDKDYQNIFIFICVAIC